MKDLQGGQTADHRRHNCWKQNRDRMDVAFIEDSKNHVHDEHRADEKQWQRREKLAKHERFTLESRLHARMLALNLGERFFDVLCRVTNRDAGEQIEIDRDAGELIKMVHRLRTNDLR